MARHVCCLLLQQSIELVYIEDTHVVLREHHQDHTQIAQNIIAFQAQDIRVLLVRFDEELYYEKTPMLYPWELAAFTQRQMRKRFSDSSFVHLITQPVFKQRLPWEMRGYHVCYYGLSMADDVNMLLATLSSSGVPVVAVSSSGLSAYRTVLQLFPDCALLSQSEGTILFIRIDDHEFRQLFVYQGLTMVSRLITVDSISLASQYQRLLQEVSVLIKYVKTQHFVDQNVIPSLFFVAGKQDVSDVFDDSFATLTGCMYDQRHFLRLANIEYSDAFLVHQSTALLKNFYSDYVPVMVRQVQRIIALRKPLVFVSLLVVLGASLFIAGLQRQMNVLSDVTHNVQSALSSLVMPGNNAAPEGLSTASLKTLQERLSLITSISTASEKIHILGMLHHVASILYAFPEFQLTDVLYEAGTEHINQGFVHDIHQQRLHLTGYVDATQLASLQSEVALLKRLQDALSKISHVQKVMHIDGQLMSLDQKSLSVSLSQNHLQSVKHDVHLVLEVSAK